MGTSTRHPPVTCPTCGHRLDAATAVDDEDAVPSKGDLSVCIGCGGILIFDEALILQVPTLAQLSEIPKDLSEVLAKVQRAIRVQNALQ